MFNEILKFGAYIVDAIREYMQPVFVYLPPLAELRGGAWYYNSDPLFASNRFDTNPPFDDAFANGFRVASVPEPSALSLLAIGLGGLAILCRRK
jgi:hypothetical protein